jgi:hypothetical protein
MGSFGISAQFSTLAFRGWGAECCHSGSASCQKGHNSPAPSLNLFAESPDTAIALSTLHTPMHAYCVLVTPPPPPPHGLPPLG